MGRQMNLRDSHKALSECRCTNDKLFQFYMNCDYSYLQVRLTEEIDLMNRTLDVSSHLICTQRIIQLVSILRAKLKE